MNLPHRSSATIATACVAGAGVAVAVASAFRNPNLPVRAGKRPAKLRVLIVQLIVQKETTGRSAWIAPRQQAVPSVQGVPKEAGVLTDLIDLTDPIEATARSAPNSVRLRDTSPSSCRENPSPSISVWLRPRPYAGRKGLPSQR